MAITTYTELQEAIAAWLARSDLAAFIPDFVSLAEQRLFYGADDPRYHSPPLRLRAMEAVTDPAEFRTSAGMATVALPPGFLEARAVALATDPLADLDFATQKQLNGAWPINGRPRLYTLQGDALRLAPVPDDSYGIVLSYYRKPDPLAVTPTNWLLANAPGVYLYAALLEAQPFLLDDARIETWAAMLGAATRALMQADQRDRWSGQLRIRAESTGP